jgi:AbrB family looped-hinge helix DNA binding protein
VETTRLSSKEQVIIPKAIRESRHWQPGTEFLIEENAAGLFLEPSKLFPPTRVEDGIGCAGRKGPAKTLEEPEEGVACDLRRSWPTEKRR